MNRDELITQLIQFMTAFKRDVMHTVPSGKLQLTPGQNAMLLLIASADGMSLKDLANELSVTPGAVTQQVDLMERAGLLERRQSSADRRVVTIRLTGGSKRQVGKLLAQRRKLLEDKLGPLSDTELEILVHIFGKVVRKKGDK